MKGCTIAFLKTKIKHEFYFINNDNIPTEITPLEAIKIFEADINEKTAPLIENHHNHVKAALINFSIEDKKNYLSQVDPTALGPVAQRSKKFISDIVKSSGLNEDLRNKLKKMILLIDYGKFTNLASDIDKIQKQFKKNKINISLCINNLEQIYKEYDLDLFESNPPAKEEIEPPKLILSESFI